MFYAFLQKEGGSFLVYVAGPQRKLQMKFTTFPVVFFFIGGLFLF